MKRLTLLCSVVLLLIATFAQTTLRAQRRNNPPTAPANPPAASKNPPASLLPLKRVILYSNGVAYFERRGKVSGKAEINLAFKQSQVDDVLKSLVVLDLGKGRIGAVSYNSSAPPSARLNEIPFSIEAATQDGTTGGLAGVLQQLQGAKVSVTTATRTATGSIITIGERTQPATEKEKPTLKTHTLVIASENGELQSFNLTEVRAVKLLDEGAKSDLTQFAEASASARRRDAKTITVTSEGEAEREMVISYTVAAPIWKTTYRVVLDQAGKPFFQGWAIVDNVSEEDWTEVALSMVSGTPVSFIQPIQKPMYRYRPIVPMPQDLNLNPQVYDPDAGVGSGIGMGQGGGVGRGEGLSNLGGVAGNMLPPPPPKPIPQQLQNNTPFKEDNLARRSGSVGSGLSKSIEEVLTSGESGIETAAQGGEVGELFEYRIEQPITVRKNRSALIPILQTKMEGERVSIYNEATSGGLRNRPMNGVRLKNTSKLTLEGGALTILDGDAYAGEALIERLKPEEQRFISFGLDLGTLVTSTSDTDRKPVFLVRARNGVFETHYYQTFKKVYTVINQTDKKRVVYLEQPIIPNWKLSTDTKEPVSKTQSVYRFRIELEPNAKVEFPITQTQALLESYQISNISTRDVELFIANRYIDAATRAELEKLIEIKGRIERAQARITALQGEANEIEDDQKRLRENIKSLKDTVDAKQLIARYINKADLQETRLEQIKREQKDAQAERARFEAELAAAIKAMNLEKTL